VHESAETEPVTVAGERDGFTATWGEGGGGWLGREVRRARGGLAVGTEER
jgi:hypothetical protein